MEQLKCIGCGATIQTENPKEIGYTPKSSVEKMENQIIYCQRCFKLKHYNEVSDYVFTNATYKYYKNLQFQPHHQIAQD